MTLWAPGVGRRWQWIGALLSCSACCATESGDVRRASMDSIWNSSVLGPCPVQDGLGSTYNGLKRHEPLDPHALRDEAFHNLIATQQWARTLVNTYIQVPE